LWKCFSQNGGEDDKIFKECAKQGFEKLKENRDLIENICLELFSETPKEVQATFGNCFDSYDSTGTFMQKLSTDFKCSSKKLKDWTHMVGQMAFTSPSSDSTRSQSQSHPTLNPSEIYRFVTPKIPKN